MKTLGTEHVMRIRGIDAMIFYTDSDEPVTYSSRESWHYAYQGDKIVATFCEPEWMRQ